MESGSSCTIFVMGKCMVNSIARSVKKMLLHSLKGKIKKIPLLRESRNHNPSRKQSLCKLALFPLYLAIISLKSKIDRPLTLQKQPQETQSVGRWLSTQWGDLSESLNTDGTIDIYSHKLCFLTHSRYCWFGCHTDLLYELYLKCWQ